MIAVSQRRDVVSPDLVLAPLVGFDREKYRLGYGGGYFDRTLAASQPRPIAIGEPELGAVRAGELRLVVAEVGPDMRVQ